MRPVWKSGHCFPINSKYKCSNARWIRHRKDSCPKGPTPFGMLAPRELPSRGISTLFDVNDFKGFRGLQDAVKAENLRLRMAERDDPIAQMILASKGGVGAAEVIGVGMRVAKTGFATYAALVALGVAPSGPA